VGFYERTLSFVKLVLLWLRYIRAPWLLKSVLLQVKYTWFEKPLRLVNELSSDWNRWGSMKPGFCWISSLASKMHEVRRTPSFVQLILLGLKHMGFDEPRLLLPCNWRTCSSTYPIVCSIRPPSAEIHVIWPTPSFVKSVLFLLTYMGLDEPHHLWNSLSCNSCSTHPIFFKN
jgi:hypothetical protein